MGRVAKIHEQAHSQSCNALAIIITLAELGKGSYAGNKGEELTLHSVLKRSKKAGEEEIMPYRTVEYLKYRKGLDVTVVEDQTRTAVLKASVTDLYNDWMEGLKAIRSSPALRKLDLVKDFEGDARVFLIVGFMDKRKLMTHTILARKEAAKYCVLNPDGGTDDEYTLGHMQGFLSAPMNKPVPFANRDYIYTGIAIVNRV